MFTCIAANHTKLFTYWHIALVLDCICICKLVICMYVCMHRRTYPAAKHTKLFICRYIARVLDCMCICKHIDMYTCMYIHTLCGQTHTKLFTCRYIAFARTFSGVFVCELQANLFKLVIFRQSEHGLNQ
jgi:hypothetical protein